MSGDHPRSWCEIDTARLSANLQELNRVTSPGSPEAPKLGVVVKANAYGHGLTLAARAFVDAGAEWLCVDSFEEGAALRAAGFEEPVLVLGWVPPELHEETLRLGLRLVIYSRESLDTLEAAARATGRVARVHIKVETGNNRQGLSPDEVMALARLVAATPGVELEGMSTHFADIEDTTDHSFARVQLARFKKTLGDARAEGLGVTVAHCANSAAAMLWPETHFHLVRLGIAAYGMWPSRETYISALTTHRDAVRLRPALTWKTRIAQLKTVPAGESVGYGRSYQVTHTTRLAVLPVGYYDGYDRHLSNTAYVLVRGHRAPVRGRVCMNMIMVDVTDVPGVCSGDEVVLLGEQEGERLSAEQLADWVGTINYEVTTRIAAHLPRRAVSSTAGRPEE